MVDKWYGLFSHTGKELEALVLSPDVDLRLSGAITSNVDYDGNLPILGVRLYKLASRADVNWMLTQPHIIQDNSLITLNGYMGILPADVLQDLHSRGCKIYNIHPAPIQLYPDLRGKDPQERMYEGIQEHKYGFIGVVIHEVDAGVDTGKLVHWVLEIADPSMTKNELYQRLHVMGTQAWKSFFKERMYENGENT